METASKKTILEINKLPIKIRLLMENFKKGEIGIVALIKELKCNNGLNITTRAFIATEIDKLIENNSICQATINDIDKLLDIKDPSFPQRIRKETPIPAKKPTSVPLIFSTTNEKTAPNLNIQEMDRPQTPSKTNVNRRGVEEEDCLKAIIGESPEIKKLIERIKKLAKFNSDRKVVLITGESGSGKELVAKAFHALSPRKDNPLVTINCGAIPTELIESEFFGHRKGSFTGALNDHRGHFLSADGGTVFLDEIGELPLAAQAKLLRVIQNGEIQPIGGFQKNVDFVLVAATNRNLENEVKKGNFREDLYYRLNAMRLHVPSLRERKEDIGILAKHFLDVHKNKNNLFDLHFHESALTKMIFMDWPGNIRQLENFILQQVVEVSGNIINIDDTESQNEENVLLKIISSAGLDDIMEHIKKHILIYTLFLCNGSVKDAAEMLGKNRTNLHKILSQHEITRRCDEIDPEKISLLIKFLSK